MNEATKQRISGAVEQAKWVWNANAALCSRPAWLNQKRDRAIGDLREWIAVGKLCGGYGLFGAVEKERHSYKTQSMR